MPSGTVGKSFTLMCFYCQVITALPVSASSSLKIYMYQNITRNTTNVDVTCGVLEDVWDGSEGREGVILSQSNSVQ